MSTAIKIGKGTPELPQREWSASSGKGDHWVWGATGLLLSRDRTWYEIAGHAFFG